MVIADICYDTNLGSYNVGAVKPAAKSCLNYSYVNILFAEIVERHRRK